MDDQKLDNIKMEEIAETTITPTRTYLNKQNRNTLAALLRSRTKVFHKWGTTYNVGKNKAKREKRKGV